MRYCIYTKKAFANSTGEHVLQNFLGARWKSNKIVSNEIQKKFANSIDVALERGLQGIRSLLGTKGGRGGTGPTIKSIETTKGQKLNLRPGGIPVISGPTVKIKPISEGIAEAQITLGNEEQLGWAINKLCAIPRY